MELRGKVALVTGGNGGLGQRICHALAREGVHIAVMYAQSKDQAEAVARELTSTYQINAAAFGCDITDGAAVEALIAAVTARFGRLDILINDAAFNKSVPFQDLDSLTVELWEKIMAVNAVSKAGLIHLTRCMAVALAPETLVNCVAPGLLEGTRATANLRPEQIERSAASSLLQKAADKDDCADMVATMCRTDTMTGQTIVIDAGRIFH
jgi:3-oxoacyl-[acyl-carrier protein] reductase